MTYPLSAKFFNQIYTPATQLLSTLASHPFAVEPESNLLLHQFEGIVLHTNHFGEKNKLQIQIDKSFRDLANSIKHAVKVPTKRVDIQSAIIFEVKQNTFRFIRNTIIAKYPTSNSEFDAIEKLHEVIRAYFPLVGLNIPSFDIPESTYPFYEWMIAYDKDGLAALTHSIRIITVQKDQNNYTKVDPANFKFVVLNGNVIGQNPEPYYPKT